MHRDPIEDYIMPLHSLTTDELVDLEGSTLRRVTLGRPSEGDGPGVTHETITSLLLETDEGDHTAGRRIAFLICDNAADVPVIHAVECPVAAMDDEDRAIVDEVARAKWEAASVYQKRARWARRYAEAVVMLYKISERSDVQREVRDQVWDLLSKWGGEEIAS